MIERSGHRFRIAYDLLLIKELIVQPSSRPKRSTATSMNVILGNEGIESFNKTDKPC